MQFRAEAVEEAKRPVTVERICRNCGDPLGQRVVRNKHGDPFCADVCKDTFGHSILKA